MCALWRVLLASYRHQQGASSCSATAHTVFYADRTSADQAHSDCVHSTDADIALATLLCKHLACCCSVEGIHLLVHGAQHCLSPVS